MVGSTGTLMTMRLVRSKLRKREESSVSPANVESTQGEQHHHNNHLQQQQQAIPVAFRQNPSSVWVFPPLPPQPNICYTNSQVSFIIFLLIFITLSAYKTLKTNELINMWRFMEVGHVSSLFETKMMVVSRRFVVGLVLISCRVCLILFILLWYSFLSRVFKYTHTKEMVA